MVGECLRLKKCMAALSSYLAQRGAVQGREPASARHARRPLMPDGEMLPSRQAYLCFMVPPPVKRPTPSRRTVQVWRDAVISAREVVCWGGGVRVFLISRGCFGSGEAGKSFVV